MLNNNKKVALELVEGVEEKEDSLVNKNIWQHFGFSYNEDSGEASFFLNTVRVMKGNTQLNLKNINANPILACLQYTGDFTEFRIWRYLRTEKEMREEYTYPLGIIAEKKSAIKVIISNKSDRDREGPKTVGFEDAKIESTGMEFGDFSITMPDADTSNKVVALKDAGFGQEQTTTAIDPLKADESKPSAKKVDLREPDIMISPPVTDNEIQE